MAKAYDFTYVCPTGQTLYYTVYPDPDIPEQLLAKVVAPGGNSSSGWNSYTKPTGHVEIPTLVRNNNRIYPVCTIESYAFYGCSDLTEVTISGSIKIIGGYAFWNCPNLTTVHFNATECTQMYTRTGSSSSTYQYYSVFNSETSTNGSTPIVTLTIGDNVTIIPDYAFKNSPNMTSVLTISDMVTSIGEYAFYGCHSQELTIGEGVTSIGNYAFWNCPNLQTVHFNAVNCTQMHTDIWNSTFYEHSYYSVFNRSTTPGEPSYITNLSIGNNVTRIPEYAFKNAEYLYERLIIPSSVSEIAHDAFYHCIALVLVDFNEGLQTIGDYAFYQCSNLQGRFSSPRGVYIPNSTTTIGKYAFYGCHSIPLLSIGEGVATIDQYAFWDCPLMHKVYFNAVNCTTMVTNSQYSVSSYSFNHSPFRRAFIVEG
jgi:hypothetical protein